MKLGLRICGNIHWEDYLGEIDWKSKKREKWLKVVGKMKEKARDLILT